MMPASAVVLALVRETPPEFVSVSTRSGAAVGSTGKPSWSPSAEYGVGVVTFSRPSSQFLNVGARTLRLACGGFTAVVIFQCIISVDLVLSQSFRLQG